MSNKESNKSNNSSNSSNSSNSEIDWSEFIIKDRYIILNKIGKGSYCTVWSVYDIKLQKLYALKIYNIEDIEDAENEIEVLNKIKELNLSNIILYNESFKYDYGEDIYIMLLIELCGYSLNFLMKLFKEDFNIDNELYEKYINFIHNSYLKLNNLLIGLHKNEYCHTDIKPENILIDIPILENNLYLNKIKNIHNNLIRNKNKKKIIRTLQIECKNIIDIYKIKDSDIKNYLKNFDYSIKLNDFGTTLKSGDDTIYSKHTQYYKSPKILLKFPLDYTYDYWSLACTLYELLTMEILFDPYNYEIENKYGENDDKNLMYLIVSTLGIPNKKILLESKEADVYFDSSYKLLRGYNDIKFNNFIEKLIEKMKNINSEIIKNKYNELINIIIKYLSYQYLYNDEL